MAKITGDRMSKICGKKFIGELDQKNGLKSFEVRKITSVEDLPYNIYPCFETDQIKAMQEMYLAINTAPYNAAIWFGGNNIDCPHIDERIPRFKRENITSRSCTETFKTALENGYQSKGQDITPIHRQWIDATHHFIAQTYAAFPEGSIIEYALEQDFAERVRGVQQTRTHFDLKKSSQRTKHGQIIDTLPLILWNQNLNHGTWVVDADNIEEICYDFHGKEHKKMHFKNDHAVFYEIPSQTPFMMRQESTSRTLCAHTTPVNFNEEINRKLWIFDLKMQNNITEFFDEHYEAFFDRLFNDPRHRHIVETRPDLVLEPSA